MKFAAFALISAAMTMGAVSAGPYVGGGDNVVEPAIDANKLKDLWLGEDEVAMEKEQVVEALADDDEEEEEVPAMNSYPNDPAKSVRARKIEEEANRFYIPKDVKVRDWAKEEAPEFVLREYKRTHVASASPFNTKCARWGSCGPTTPYAEYCHLVANIPLRYIGRINNNPNDDILCRKPFFIEVLNLKNRRWIRVKVAGVNYNARRCSDDDIQLSEKAYALIGGGCHGPSDSTPVVWRFAVRE